MNERMNTKRGRRWGWGALIGLGATAVGGLANADVAEFLIKALETYGAWGVVAFAGGMGFVYLMRQAAADKEQNRKLQDELLRQIEARDKDWEERYRARTQEYIELKAQIDTVEKERDEAKREYDRMRKELNDIRTMLDLKDERLHRLEVLTTDQRAAIEQFKAANETLRTKLDDERGTVERLTVENHTLKIETARIGQLEEEIKRLNLRVDDLKVQVETYQKENETLRRDLTAARALVNPGVETVSGGGDGSAAH